MESLAGQNQKRLYRKLKWKQFGDQYRASSVFGNYAITPVHFNIVSYQLETPENFRFYKRAGVSIQTFGCRYQLECQAQVHFDSLAEQFVLEVVGNSFEESVKVAALNRINEKWFEDFIYSCDQTFSGFINALQRLDGIEERMLRFNLIEADNARMQVVQQAALMCGKHDMPSVPFPSQRWRENRKPNPGIYFIWNNAGACVYVGKSSNIYNRVNSSHTHVKPGRTVSFLYMDETDIHHAELFYIWLLKPVENMPEQCKNNERNHNVGRTT